MTEADILAIAHLPAGAFFAVLLISRIGCALMLLPGFGEAELPMRVRAGLTVVLSALVGPLVVSTMPDPPAEIATTAAIVFGEVAVGLWLGWLSRLLLLALPMAGQIIASVSGLANVLQPDPSLGPQTSVLSRLLGLAAVPALFATGLWTFPLAALVGTYHVFPPGRMVAAGDAVDVIVGGLGNSFALALRLAAPFIVASTLWHAALAVLGRLVPNLQIFFMASPGQILGGLLLLGLLGTSLMHVWQEQTAAAMAVLPGL